MWELSPDYSVSRTAQYKYHTHTVGHYWIAKIYAQYKWKHLLRFKTMFDGWSNAMFCKKRVIFLMQQVCQYYIVIKSGFDYMCYDWFFELGRQVGHVNTTHSVTRFMSYILQTIFCNFETTHVSDIYLNIVYLKVSQPLITNVTLPLLRAYGVISFLLIFFFSL